MNSQLDPAPVILTEAEPIHPYILEALQAARAGDLDAFGWLESDCICWGLIEPNAAIMARREVSKPARKRPKRKTAQEAPGRTQRARPIAQTHPARPARATLQAV